MSSTAISEFDLIARCFAPMAAPGALGLADDAALLAPPPGQDLILTKDMLVEGVHFFADDPPESIAVKALGVNLSDLAAKGAEPLGFLLGLARSPRQDRAWLDRFAAGLKAAADAAACPLLGGDTVSAPCLTLSITAFGAVPSGGMLRRQGGSPGDVLLVSGSIGDAALGLALRQSPDADWVRALAPSHHAALLERYLHPQPRLGLRSALREGASAAMDISDGLVGDSDKLASRLGRDLAVDAIPLSEAVRAAIRLDARLLDLALTGGDDYEILAAVPPQSVAAFIARAGEAGIVMTEIGTLRGEGEGNRWRNADGTAREFLRRSYVHGDP